MKIQWTKPGAKFNMGYFAGDTCDVEDKKAKEIIEAGYAVEIYLDETKIVKKKK